MVTVTRLETRHERPVQRGTGRSYVNRIEPVIENHYRIGR